MAVKSALKSIQLSLRSILMLVFAVQLLAATGVVVWLSFRNGQKAVEKMAQQLSQSVSHDIEHHLERYLDEPHQLLQIKASAVKSGSLDLTDFAQLQQDFWYLLQTQNNINHIFFYTPQGDRINVQYRDHSSPFQEVSTGLMSVQPLSQPTWSDVYHHLNTSTPAIDALIPLFNTEQEFQGVMGIEVQLSQLSSFLRDLQLTPSAQAFILDRSGNPIASSTVDFESNPAILQTAITTLNQTWTSLQQIDQPHYCQFHFQGQQQLLHILPFQDPYGLDWLVMVVIPITDFTDSFQDHTQLTVFLCGLTLALVSGLAILTARWISAPLQRLSRVAAAMAEGEVVPQFEPVGIKELNLLGHCFHQMVQQVQHNHHALEQRVEERTQQLKASHEQFAQVFRHSPVAMSISRMSNGCILDVNDAFIHSLGYPQAEAIGNTSTGLNLWVDPEDRGQLVQQLQQQGSIAHFETQLRAKSGKIINVEMCGTLMEVNHQTCLLLAGSDMTQRKRGDTERDLYESRLQMQQIVMMKLSKSAELYGGDLKAALQKITMTIAHLLDVDRVSIWFHQEDHSLLRCANLYQLHSRQHSWGEERLQANVPNYFKAIATHPLIVVDDVENDPRMQDLLSSHLKPLNITARLDVAICSEGKTVGILSLEQIDRPRQWLIEEQNFAAYFAHLIALAIEARDHAEAEAALRQSQERLQLALEGSENGLWDWNLTTGELYVSPQGIQMLGYEVEEFTGLASQWQEMIHPEDRPWVLKCLKDHLADSACSYTFDYRLRTKSEQWKWIGNYGKVVERDAQGNPVRMAGVQQDITERKKAEEKLQTSLREKEVLLREIHHRVKNNLHIISSLLDLQSDTLENEQLIEIFADSQNRIRSMALIHEQLYQSPDLGQVEFGEYIHRLMSNLFFSLGDHLNGVKPVIEVDSVYLNLETAIPCGLLINEIVTNAFKHAFPNDQSGEVDVKLHQHHQQLTLTLADNGMGIPPEIDWRNSSSLGLRLVKILSQQLKAEVKSDFSQGTYFQFIFFPLEYKRRF
jgi:PAS domain S-box-containing protein